MQEQVEKMEFNISTLQSYREMVKEFKKILTSDVSLDYVGLLLNECWESKKTLSSKITNPFFDRVYDDVMSVGAIGGKLLGAGGGGFFLFYVKPESQYAVRKVMNNFREYKFNFEDEGSVII